MIKITSKAAKKDGKLSADFSIDVSGRRTEVFAEVVSILRGLEEIDNGTVIMDAISYIIEEDEHDK